MRDHHLFVALVSSIALAACGDGGGFPDAHKSEPAPDPGTFSLMWSITGSGSGSGGSGIGSDETCDQAMATQVIVNSTNEANGDENSDEFACGLGESVSGALFIGTYDLTFSLTGSAGNTVATAPQQSGIVITSDHSTTIMPVVFVVSM